MNTAHYKNELRLTLANDEACYIEALAVTDFDWMGQQIMDLYAHAWRTINDWHGKNVAPTLYTDHDVREMHDVVIAKAKSLQYEAAQ